MSPLVRVLVAIVIAAIVAAVCVYLLGPLLVATTLPFLTALGEILKGPGGYVVGAIAGLLWFLRGSAIL